MRVRFIPFALIAALVAAVVAACSGGSGADPSATVPVSSPAGPPTPVSATPLSSGPTASSTGPFLSQTAPRPRGTEVPADVPTTGPNLLHRGERPPVMPLAATRHTPAGAVAFAKFFELTIDWAYATTSTTYMKHYYEPSCVTCKSIQLGLDKAARQHHHFIGGRMTIKDARLTLRNKMKGAERSVLVSYELTSVEVVNRHGAFIDGDGAETMRDQIWLAWRGSGWTVRELGPVK